MLEHLDRDHDGNITWAEFEKSILEEASTVDTTVYPLAGCMVAAGLSVGTIMALGSAVIGFGGLPRSSAVAARLRRRRRAGAGASNRLVRAAHV